MKGIKILGTGSYLPEVVVTNKDLEKILDTSDEWIMSRTGISERRVSGNVPNYRMSAIAAERALQASGLNAEDIDFILFSSCSPDFFFPCTSGIIQNILGAKNAAVADVNTACTGFLTALDMARNYILTGRYKNILVVAGERVSHQCDFTDRTACILFGDGAGAAVVTGSDEEYYASFGAEGDMFTSLYCKVDTSRCNSPFHAEDYPELLEIANDDHKNHTLQMDGKAVYRFAVNAMANAVNDVCEQAGITVDDIDYLVPHQANIRIIQAAVKAIDIPMEKVIVNLEKRGNVSSACIPTCLDELYREGKIKNGMRVCLVGFGAGLTYGAIIFKA